MTTAVSPLNTELAATGGVSTESREKAKAELRRVLGEYTGKVHLPEAQSQAAAQVSGLLDATLTQEAWSAALAMAEILEVVDPTNTKITRSKEKATKEMNRPKILGNPSYLTDEKTGTVVVFLRVSIPDLGKIEEEQVREGEEFAEGRMRLAEIIGRNQGIRVTYTDDGKEIEIRSR